MSGACSAPAARATPGLRWQVAQCSSKLRIVPEAVCALAAAGSINRAAAKPDRNGCIFMGRYLTSDYHEARRARSLMITPISVMVTPISVTVRICCACVSVARDQSIGRRTPNLIQRSDATSQRLDVFPDLVVFLARF